MEGETDHGRTWGGAGKWKERVRRQGDAEKKTSLWRREEVRKAEKGKGRRGKS